MKLKVATCQFPVSADIQKNYRYISSQIQEAKARGADVAHFPECALSGYAGPDFKTYKGFHWEQLEKCTKAILRLARLLKIWVILGSSHRLRGAHKPHNSLYIINGDGELVDRYDKMFCAGSKAENTGDLKYYTPGNHFSVFEIKGVTCGAQICHEYRYPEVYRKYKSKGVQLMFHSYHAGGVSPKRYREMQSYVGKFADINEGSTLPAVTMPATMRSYAANNYVWISCPNSSRKESCWPSFFVRPDGVVVGQLRRNVAGVLVSTMDAGRKLYDSTVAWRDRAMRGIFHSGTLVTDSRSDNRTKL
ncbi:MAG: carbon-nitrogen hydrolase family protein [Ignavibacteria bacterium]|nr:carbon-nitrogen hydrolase family protein [Ignavibacteria bacterium]